MLGSRTRWVVVGLLAVGCPADDEGGDTAGTPGTSGTSDGPGSDTTSGEMGSTAAEGGGVGSTSIGPDDSADGGTCSTSVVATVCAEDLSAWIDGMPGAPSCPGDGGTGGPECGTDPVQVDEEAAAALCEVVCAGCACPASQGANGCEYLGTQGGGVYEFRCSHAIGCAGAGCFE